MDTSPSYLTDKLLTSFDSAGLGTDWNDSRQLTKSFLHYTV